MILWNFEFRQSRGFGEIDAFLIEARSIGGLSGSPVFLNLGGTRFIGGEEQASRRPVFFFLGVIHGHFDVKAAAADAQDMNLTTERVNTGIAIVTPFEKVDEVIAAYRKTGVESKSVIAKRETSDECYLLTEDA